MFRHIPDRTGRGAGGYAGASTAMPSTVRPAAAVSVNEAPA